VCFLFCLKV